MPPPKGNRATLLLGADRIGRRPAATHATPDPAAKGRLHNNAVAGSAKL